ncbi:competence protein ComEC [Yersinia entomophaga]|uniref:Competence protein ComEC n=2 Tax=Yersinia entomophaga TaxID=935293 RepID=A0ABM6BH26_YERET|nr:competence protein ComEC [Yersinia entomophaga]
MLSIDRCAGALIIGLLPLMFIPRLPGTVPVLLLLFTAIILWLSGYKNARFAALPILSFLWGNWQAAGLVNQIEYMVQGDKLIVATVASISLISHREESARMLLKIEQADGRRVFPPVSVSVHWPKKWPASCSGQRWQLKIRMRPVHSLLNEGGFDSQRWAMANRRPLTGRIITGRMLEGNCHLRQDIISRTDRQLQSYSQRSLLLALAFGERGELSLQQWETLRKTGTAHLMAISGLHIVMAALFGRLLARAIQYLFPTRWIGPLLPLLCGWLLALTYVWLAGANPPALRAGLVLTLWLALRLFGVLSSPWQVWLWAVALILLSEPLTLLSDSFWLSCMAVLSLLFWLHWVPLLSPFLTKNRYAWPLRLAHLQFGMMLLLMPLQMLLFHGISLSSFPANLWAMPIVSFITVPLVLVALVFSFFSSFAEVFWSLANSSLEIAMLPLNNLKAGWQHTGETAMAIGCLGWLGVVIWRFRWWSLYPFAVIALCVNLILIAQRRDTHRWRVDMLDIGHGLAIVIERERRAVIFDTGNRWRTGSMAEKAILPYLKWRGLTVDHIILSHDHLDHSGGLELIRAAFPMAKVRAPFPIKNIEPNRWLLPCRRGDRWQWQQLDFEVLWPPQLTENAQNDDSCVIRISEGKHSLLLTGDIERKSERQLVKTSRHKLRSTLLQVPHHGSNTSSIAPFLRAVQPELAMASASRYNQWHLPAKKVINRYKENGIIWRDTSRSGQLSISFSDHDWQIKGYREQLFPRWYHQRFGVGSHNE